MVDESIITNKNIHFAKQAIDSLELIPILQNQSPNNIRINKISGKILKDKSNNNIGSYNIFTLESTLKKIALINIQGDISNNNSKEIYNSIKKSIVYKHHLIFINLEKLTYINCCGLNMLLSIAKLNGFVKNRIIFINTPPKFIELFNIIGFQKIFNFQPTLPFGLGTITDSYFSIFKQIDNSLYLEPLETNVNNQTNFKFDRKLNLIVESGDGGSRTHVP